MPPPAPPDRRRTGPGRSPRHRRRAAASIRVHRNAPARL